MAYNEVDLDRHIEATKARHGKDRAEERAYYRHVVDSLPLAGAAKEHIVQEQNAAALAHLIAHPERMTKISAMDDTSQVEELKRIRGGEPAGPTPEPDTNEDTDAGLKKRKEAILAGERGASQRERRSLGSYAALQIRR